MRVGSRTFFGWLILILAVMTMTTFGLDVARQNQPRTAIKMYDREVTFEDFYRERRELEQRYRQFLGKSFDIFAKTLDFNQQTIDQLVSSVIFTKLADDMNLAAGKKALAEQIKMMFSGANGQFSREGYSAYLREVGLTGPAFEKNLASDLRIQQLRTIIDDMTIVSKAEVRAAYARSETKATVETVSFDPAKLVSEVPTPSDEDLLQYFQDNAAEFELPAEAAYSYLVIRAADVMKDIPITDEDIELEYTDNSTIYQRPERAKVRQILFRFPEKSNDPADLAKVKEKADKAFEKLSTGQDFAKLASQLSDDIPSRINGGDIGWIERGSKEKSMEDAIFKVGAGATTDVVSLSSGYAIYQVVEKEEAKLRPLEEVRTKIETMLREREAPAYASSRAQELYEAWVQTNQSLADFAKEKGLTTAQTDARLRAESDPAPEYSGLSREVISQVENTQQLVELRDLSILVDVTEAKESRIPEFDEVKERATKELKEIRAKTLAKERAQAFLAALKEKAGEPKAFAELAKAQKLEIEKTENAQPLTGGSGVLSVPTAKSEVFKTLEAPRILPETYELNGKFLVARVATIAQPTEKELDEKSASFYDQAKREAVQALLEAITRREKAREIPVVDDALFATRL